MIEHQNVFSLLSELVTCRGSRCYASYCIVIMFTDYNRYDFGIMVVVSVSVRVNSYKRLRCAFV